MKKKAKAAVGDRYDVILTDGGDQKIEVVRIVKEITGRHRVSAELTELFDCPTPISEGVTEDQAKKVERRSRKHTARRRSSGRGVNIGVGGRTRGFAAVGRKAEEGRFEFGRTRCGASLRLPWPRSRSEPNNLVFR